MTKRYYTFNEERTFGVEIEFLATIDRYDLVSLLEEKGVAASVDAYGHEVREYWKVITDSSCGYEIVSPILKGRDGLRQVELVCEALNEMGAQVNRRCGLHVHHGIDDYNVDDMKNLVALYMKLEYTLDSFMPASRRGNENKYCRSMIGQNNVERSLQQLHSVKTMEDAAYLYPSRYRKLNMSSYLRYGTIEFRHHSGTTEYEKIYNWILLSQHLVNRARDRRVNYSFTPRWNTMHLFSTVTGLRRSMNASDELKAVLDFYKGRQKQLATA